MLKQLERNIRKWFKNHRKNTSSEIDKIYKQQDKFNRVYPQYKIGFGSYGIPKVHDWHEGTKLSIGSYCSIASAVSIYLGGHHREDWVSSYPFPAFMESAKDIKDYGGTNGDVIIGNDVWVCAGAAILSGVTVGDGAVIANGALVTRDVEPYSIVGGNPAQHIRYRFEPDMVNRLLATQWWSWPIDEIESVVDLICSKDVEKLLQYAESRNLNAKE